MSRAGAHKLQVTATKSGAETVSPPGTTATPRAATNGTTASVPTTAAGTPRMTATAVDAAAANASGTPLGQSHRTVSGKLATANDFCCIPAGKLGAPELQASVLQVSKHRFMRCQDVGRC